MASTAILTTYGDSSRQNDVASLVEILTPKENWLLRNLPKGMVQDTIVQTMTDTLRTAASAAVSEQGDYTALENTTPSLLTNLVEIVAIPFKVARTQNDISKYTNQNETARQTAKRIVDWSNAAEFSLMRGTLTSGASGTAPKLAGVIAATSKSSNHTTQTSTTAFTVSILQGLMKNSWDNSNGVVPTDIFVGSIIADAMDNFSAKSNVVIDGSNERTIINAVDIFETGFGKLRKRLHRYITESTDAHDRVLAINPQYLEIGYLKEPYLDDGLQRAGDYDSFAIVGKLTLRVRNQDVHFFADGYKK